jgi:hypothetical protein
MMRIINRENEKQINSVMIMLTEKEAHELSDLIASINPEEGDHIHVNDLEYKREITVLIYTPNNLHFFNDKIKEAIGKVND